MNGKDKCNNLRRIRQRIAQANEIPYETKDCGFEGDCRGTCPKCEQELHQLENELKKKRSLGKTIAVAAVAAGMVVSMTGCDLPFGNQLEGSVSDPAYTETETLEVVELEGDVAYCPETGEADGETEEREERNLKEGNADESSDFVYAVDDETEETSFTYAVDDEEEQE